MRRLLLKLTTFTNQNIKVKHSSSQMKVVKPITRAVWILSLVSLFTDVASEMLYPILPIYLKSIGFSIVLIGVLEGIAEATAGLSKGYFGKLSDVAGRRAPFVRWGYALSAISKPMMALFVYPLWVFLARTLDRLGKGIRTGARDAILSDESTPATKGKVFGFHRSMDTLGAVLGPLLALGYLYFYPEDYKTLFFIAFAPGLLAIFATSLLRDKVHPQKAPLTSVSFFSFFNYLKDSPIAYKRLVLGLLVFALFNSSDVFLLLKAKEAGLNDTATIGVYIFYNLIFALTAYPLGVLSDKIGFKKVFILGLLLFAVVYFGMAFTTDMRIFYLLFFLYGIFAAATDGVSKAWISNVIDRENTATAIGTFAGFQSICAMLASSITGLLWYQFGASTAFLTTATITVLVVVYLLVVPIKNHSI